MLGAGAIKFLVGDATVRAFLKGPDGHLRMLQVWMLQL